MIYFDNSATTFFKPNTVKSAVMDCINTLCTNPGRGSHGLSVKASVLVYDTRSTLASFVSLKNEQRMIFTLNCSDALNLAILGSIKKGSHVITTCFEHNSVLRPLFAKSKDVDVTILSPTTRFSNLSANQVEKAIRKNTTTVIVNHVSNVNGSIQPIEEIGKVCKKHGITFIVDGAQSVGHIDVSMEKQGISMLSIAPHKGIHGIMGVGCLAVDEQVEITPIRFGGTGTFSHELNQPTSMPEGYEVGTLPLCAISSIIPAINWCNENKTTNRSHISSLSRLCLQNLSNMDGITLYTKLDSENGIIAFNSNSHTSSYVCDYLYQNYQICCRCGFHCAPLMHEFLGTNKHGCVRISLGVDNTEEEIFTLIKALERI